MRGVTGGRGGEAPATNAYCMPLGRVVETKCCKKKSSLGGISAGERSEEDQEVREEDQRMGRAWEVDEKWRMEDGQAVADVREVSGWRRGCWMFRCT